MKHYSWSAINKLGTQLIGFIGNILIARLLSPEDYGLIAMLAIFMAIAMNFTESGFGDYLIRDPKSGKKDFAVIFMHNLVFGIGFYMILFFCAPLIASFYKQPELINITRILGLSIFFKAICLTEVTRMRKELLFKNLAKISITSSIISVIIGYVLAKNGWGYWAIVMQSLSLGISNLIMIIAVNKWSPLFYFNWKRYKVMRKFGNNMLISYFTNQLGSNLYAVVIGKFYSPLSLGYFYQSEKISNMSFQSINSIILTTSYSLLANQEDKIKRRKMYKTILNHFLFLHFNLNLFLVGCAYQIIAMVFGEQWIPSVPLLQLLLLSYLLQPLVTLNSNIIKIENKPALYRNLTFLRNGLIFLALLTTFKYSIITIIYGQIAARYLSVVIDVLVCGKYIDLSPNYQWRLALKQVLGPTLSLLAAYNLMVNIPLSQNWQLLIIYGLTYTLVFIIFNTITKNQSFHLILNKIKTLMPWI